MGLLLLKLWVIGLDCKLVYNLGKTVQERHGSGQLPLANS